MLMQRRSPFLCLTQEEFNALPMPQQKFAVTFAATLCASSKPPINALWRWSRRKADYAVEIALFRIYLEEGRKAMPTLSSSNDLDREAYEISNRGEKMGNGRSIGAPLLAQLILFCLTQLRLTYEEALESPYGAVVNLYFTHLESHGHLYVENYDEREARAEMQKHRKTVLDEEAQAKQAWAAAKTPEELAAAYAKFPRIGNIFGSEWHQATTDAKRSALVNKWGIVAKTELAKAGIIIKEIECQD